MLYGKHEKIYVKTRGFCLCFSIFENTRYIDLLLYSFIIESTGSPRSMFKKRSLHFDNYVLILSPSGLNNLAGHAIPTVND